MNLPGIVPGCAIKYIHMEGSLRPLQSGRDCDNGESFGTHQDSKDGVLASPREDDCNDEPASRMDHSRERNRIHAKKSRQRKKAFIETLRNDFEARNAELDALVTLHSRYLPQLPFKRTLAPFTILDEDADENSGDGSEDGQDDALDHSAQALSGVNGPQGEGEASSDGRKRVNVHPDNRAERCRERNKIHARKSRQRKKRLVDSMKVSLNAIASDVSRLTEVLTALLGAAHPELVAVIRAMGGVEHSSRAEGGAVEESDGVEQPHAHTVSIPPRKRGRGVQEGGGLHASVCSAHDTPLGDTAPGVAKKKGKVCHTYGSGTLITTVAPSFGHGPVQAGGELLSTSALALHLPWQYVGSVAPSVGVQGIGGMMLGQAGYLPQVSQGAGLYHAYHAGFDVSQQLAMSPKQQHNAQFWDNSTRFVTQGTGFAPPSLPLPMLPSHLESTSTGVSALMGIHSRGYWDRSLGPPPRRSQRVEADEREGAGSCALGMPLGQLLGLAAAAMELPPAEPGQGDEGMPVQSAPGMGQAGKARKAIDGRQTEPKGNAVSSSSMTASGRRVTPAHHADDRYGGSEEVPVLGRRKKKVHQAGYPGKGRPRKTYGESANNEEDEVKEEAMVLQSQ